jgi:hypothetical protein
VGGYNGLGGLPGPSVVFFSWLSPFGTPPSLPLFSSWAFEPLYAVLAAFVVLGASLIPVTWRLRRALVDAGDVAPVDLWGCVVSVYGERFVVGLTVGHGCRCRTCRRWQPSSSTGDGGAGGGCCHGGGCRGCRCRPVIAVVAVAWVVAVVVVAVVVDDGGGMVNGGGRRKRVTCHS